VAEVLEQIKAEEAVAQQELQGREGGSKMPVPEIERLSADSEEANC